MISKTYSIIFSSFSHKFAAQFYMAVILSRVEYLLSESNTNLSRLHLGVSDLVLPLKLIILSFFSVTLSRSVRKSIIDLFSVSYLFYLKHNDDVGCESLKFVAPKASIFIPSVSSYSGKIPCISTLFSMNSPFFTSDSTVNYCLCLSRCFSYINDDCSFRFSESLSTFILWWFSDLLFVC